MATQFPITFGKVARLRVDFSILGSSANFMSLQPTKMLGTGGSWNPPEPSLKAGQKTSELSAIFQLRKEKLKEGKTTTAD